MAQVRALAIHIPSDLQPIDMLDKVINIVDKVTACAKAYGVTPWTLRLVFPVIQSFQTLDRYLSDLFSIKSDIMASIGIEGEYLRSNEILQLLNTYEGLYSSARCDSDHCTEKVIDDLYMKPCNDVDINIYTKFALLIGSWIETPYFPATSNISNSLGLSLSLRYVDLMKRALVDGVPQELFEFIEKVYNMINYVSACTGTPFLGLDLSLSPWGDESVAELIEKLIGSKIGFPGTINVIHGLNKLIESIIKKLKIRSIGFNEVMMPVAEDNVLNERVRDDDIRLRDLVNYSMVCIVGLDMVAVPRSHLNLKRIAIDMFTVYKIKRRNIAMRIIPVDQEPGSSIILKRFGTTYVAVP